MFKPVYYSHRMPFKLFLRQPCYFGVSLNKCILSHKKRSRISINNIPRYPLSPKLNLYISFLTVEIA